MVAVTGHPPREQLAAFLAGKLSSDELARLADHIGACDACCQMLRDLPEDEFSFRVRCAHTPPGEDAAAAELSLPRELLDHPRYRLGRFLGRGGMGAVYLAEHRLMNRPVALKIIHRELCRHPRIIDRFRQEVKAAARLSHPNIVAAYDADQAGDSHFLVMEYVEGMSLAQLVAKRGPLEIAYACYFIRQAAKGLHHAFEAGMVHRDIKPHNLMLTRKGQIKILDFGLARLAREQRNDLGLPVLSDGPGLTKVGDVMGTPEYMAPEQIHDPSTADIRADIYSLGCTLYFLLTGRSPFAHIERRTALLSPKTRQSRPIRELRKEVPPGLVIVIEKMIAKEPGQRYQTPAEVVKALAPFARPTAVSVPTAAVAKPAATPAPVEPHTFAAQCPFCQANFRVPDKALGASIPCPQCRSFFTVVPSV